MRSLADFAGIDIEWAADGTLKFDSALVVDETLQRPRERLRTVTLNPDSCEPPTRTQYWMYNGIARREERERLQATGMRYELTLMFPDPLGRESAKTLGHLHSAPAGSALNYPEICEVLHGTAYFVFQTMNIPARTAPFCAVLEAHPGDKVIIPPNLHHLTVNGGDEPLLFSDVIPLDCRGIYDPLATMHGAAWLNTLDAGWIKNPTYNSAAEPLRWSAADYPALGLTSDRPLYKTFVESAGSLSWMVHPDDFSRTFPLIWRDIEAVISV